MSSQANEKKGDKKTRAPLPALQIAVRSETLGVQFRNYQGPLKQGDTLATTGTTVTSYEEEPPVVYSQDGTFAAVIEEKSVSVYSTGGTEEINKIVSLPRPNVHTVLWCPDNDKVITYEIRREDKKQNLVVWNLDGEILLQLYQKEVRKSVWPTIAWNADGSLLAHVRGNAVHIYDGKAPTTPVAKIQQDKVAQFSWAPSGNKIAIFAQGTPSRGQYPFIAVYEYPNVEKSQRICAKGLTAKVDDAQIKWSPTCDHILVLASTETKSNFYYGDGALILISTDAKKEFAGVVPFGGNKGPVQAAEWSPDGRDFMVIQGYQPARITLFLANGLKPVRDYGQAPRNTISFSPHGRFICIGGYGNLAGEADFWDKNKFRRIGFSQHSDATHWQWTPDSRNFITSTTRPRRRIDERFIVWTYAGEKVCEEKVERLCQIAVRPAPTRTTYPNRPLSSRLKNVSLKQLASAKPQKYVPPSMRNRGGHGATFMDRKLAQPRKFVNNNSTGAPTRATMQQQANMDKNAKRRARRARQRAAKAAEKAAAAAAAS